jgi:hypothetical protein
MDRPASRPPRPEPSRDPGAYPKRKRMSGTDIFIIALWVATAVFVWIVELS